MTPRDIITGLRAAGVCPMLPCESGRIRARGRRNLLESANALNLILEMHRQYAACIAFLRSEFQPWRPCLCVLSDAEIDASIIEFDQPDADPDTLEVVREALRQRAALASMRMLTRLMGEGAA